MQMSKNVNNDVSKDLPIKKLYVSEKIPSVYDKTITNRYVSRA